MQFSSAARGRPIIVEWERDARHSAGLSFGDSSCASIKPVHIFMGPAERCAFEGIFSRRRNTAASRSARDSDGAV
ncbi:hypothetical protein EVAR_833_1 [Eumeta japonica]|uniref:Uncharacterized protein n=1 Tax=Eumeta variegata TaxID=151549 RepID=A0A4C1SEB2_EUMVA|nr:hypothetical protein EVAR_833_1 [Eumeta japonica]